MGQRPPTLQATSMWASANHKALKFSDRQTQGPKQGGKVGKFRVPRESSNRGRNKFNKQRLIHQGRSYSSADDGFPVITNYIILSSE
jgi:hypothetical protein